MHNTTEPAPGTVSSPQSRPDKSHVRHRHADKTRKKLTRRVSKETFIARNILNIAAVLFFISGFLWLAYKNAFSGLLAWLSADTGDQMINLTYDVSPLAMLLFLLPGFVLLAFSWLNHQAAWVNSTFTNVAFTAGSLWIGIVFVMEFLYCDFLGGTFPFPTVIQASFAALGSIMLVFYLAKTLSKPSFFLVSIPFQYLIFVLFWQGYGMSIHVIFPCIALFSLLLFYFSSSFRGLPANTINAFFAISYLALLFARKFLIQHSPSLIEFYLGYSTLLYVVLMLIRRLSTYTGLKTWKILADRSLAFLLTLFFLFSNLWMLRSYGYEWAQLPFAAGVTLLNLGFWALDRWLKGGQSVMSLYDYLLLIPAALLLPLLFGQDVMVLYPAVTALMLALLAQYRKTELPLVLSVGSLSVAAVILLYKIALNYLPGLYLAGTGLPFAAFFSGFITIGATTLAAGYLTSRMDRTGFAFSLRWFHKDHILSYLNILYYGLSYLFGAWIFQYLYTYFFPDFRVASLGLFTFHSGFVLFFLLRRKESSNLTIGIVRAAAIATLVLLPLLMASVLPVLQGSMMNTGGVSRGNYLFHLVPVILNGILVWQLTIPTGRNPHKLKAKLAPFFLVRFFYLTYLFILEFNQLSILKGSPARSPEFILTDNRLLPYTLIFFVAAFLLMIFSFVLKQKVYRRISLVILVLATIKLFLLDFNTLNATYQVLIFWGLGTVLLGYSFLYQRFRRRGSVERKEGAKG